VNITKALDETITYGTRAFRGKKGRKKKKCKGNGRSPGSLIRHGAEDKKHGGVDKEKRTGKPGGKKKAAHSAARKLVHPKERGSGPKEGKSQIRLLTKSEKVHS